MTRHRRALVEIFQNPKVDFPREGLDAFVAKLPQTDLVRDEWENVKKALETGEAPKTPNINVPETQLMWAAALIHLTKAGPQMHAEGHPMKDWNYQFKDADISKTRIWRQLTESPQAEFELQQHAWHLSSTIRNPQTRIGWNKPGSWFYFSPDENRINLDFMNSLLGGFEHSRSVVFHEIAHSQLTVRFTPRMQELREEIVDLQERAKKQKQGHKYNVRGKLSKDDYKRLAMLSAEFKLWMQLYNVTEDNCVNRYSADKSKELSQDYSYSLNHVNTTITRIGRDEETIRREKKAEEQMDTSAAGVRFNHLCKAVVSQFFRTNEFFENTEKGWEKVRVHPEWIDEIAEEYEDDLKSGRRAANDNREYDGIRPDFKTLRDLCSGPDGLENLQPKPKDKLYGPAYFDALVKDYNDKRNKIVELIWNLYARKYVEEMLKEHEKKLDQELGNDDQDQDGQDQDGQDQDGQGEGEGQDQDQDGQDQDGQGQGQGQGKPDPNGKPQQGGGGGQPQPGDQSQQQPGDQSGGGDDQQGDQQGDQQDGDGAGQDPYGDPMDEGAGGGAGDENDGKIDVDDVGEMPDYNTPPEAPGMEDPNGQDQDGQDADGQGQDGQGQDGQDGDGQDGKTIQELLDEMQDQADADADGQGQDADGQGQDGQDGDGQGQPGQGQPGQSGQSGEGGGDQGGEGGEGLDLDKLAQKNWDNYQARVRELAGPIKMVERMMRKIQEQQVQEKTRRSRDLEILPEDGEFDRFNQDSQLDYIRKRRTGQKITEQDMKRFHKDETFTEPTQLDVVIMIDGSGSMDSPIKGYNNGGAKYVEAALLASAVLYEAAKRVGFNVYVGMWGSNNPMVLARPGDKAADVGRRFGAAQKGLNSGTDLAPAIDKAVQMLIEQRENPVELFGHTHMLVLSDGDINDAEKAQEKLTKLLRASPRTTFDAAVMKDQETAMERMAKSVEAKRPQQQVKVVRDNDANTIPLSIIKLVLEKMRTSKSFKALPNQVKKRHMRKAANRMGLRNGR